MYICIYTLLLLIFDQKYVLKSLDFLFTTALSPLPALPPPPHRQVKGEAQEGGLGGTTPPNIPPAKAAPHTYIVCVGGRFAPDRSLLGGRELGGGVGLSGNHPP